MAVPWSGYLAESVFELGVPDADVWSSKVDTQSKLNVRHYSYLVGQQRLEIPYRGAYALECDLSLGTADAYEQSLLWARALGSTIWTRFLLHSEGLVMAVSDKFSLIEIQSVGPVTQAMVGIRNNGGRIQVYAAQTQASATTVGCDLIPGQYHTIELRVVVDSGAADGTIALFVDGYQVGTTITALTQAALTQARLGALGIDAGTTAGLLLFDQIVASTYRVGGFRQRYPRRITLTKSAHVAVGPGHFLDNSLIPGDAIDNFMEIYDTDEANTVEEQGMLAPDMANDELRRLAPWIPDRRDGEFNRGLFVHIQGTTPRAFVTLGQALVSSGAIRDYAVKRRAHGPW